MIVHAAFLPHSPLLLSSVHPGEEKTLAPITEAIHEVRDHLYTLAPDTIVFLAGHGFHYADAFSIEVSHTYTDDLRAFGDLTPPTAYTPDHALSDALQRAMRRAELPFTLHTSETMDYAVSVGLRFLAISTARPRVLALAKTDLPRKDHFRFGQILREVLDDRHERVAVIALGDLSHCIATSGDLDVCKEGRAFDAAVVSALEQGSSSALLAIPEETVEQAKESGYRPLVMLSGLLDHLRVRPEVLAYAAPYGVGYVVAQFHLR